MGKILLSSRLGSATRSENRRQPEDPARTGGAWRSRWGRGRADGQHCSVRPGWIARLRWVPRTKALASSQRSSAETHRVMQPEAWPRPGASPNCYIPALRTSIAVVVPGRNTPGRRQLDKNGSPGRASSGGRLRLPGVECTGHGIATEPPLFAREEGFAQCCELILPHFPPVGTQAHEVVLVGFVVARI